MVDRIAEHACGRWTMVDRDLLRRNEASRERLRSVVSGLAGLEPDRPIGDGWTVAAALAHLAFWDRYALFALERWQRDGTGLPPADADAINDSALPIWLALSPVAAGNLALSAAAAVDRAVEAAPAELIEAVVAAGRPRLDRSIHREKHLPDIERALASE
jgi:hypothetical protein